MAYIPDEAVDEAAQITSTAFKLYSLICRRRDHKRGSASLSTKSASTLLQVNLGTARRAFAELTAAQWIVRAKHLAIPIKGDFSPVHPDRDRRARTSAPTAQKSAPSAQICAPSAQKSSPTIYSYPASVSIPDLSSSIIQDDDDAAELAHWLDKVRQIHPEVRDEILELAVIHSLARKPIETGPIRSPRYFTPQILEYDQDPLLKVEATAANMRDYARQRFEKWMSLKS